MSELSRDEINARARAFLDDDTDPQTRAECETLLAAGDESALRERFATTLSFGTAGLRGAMGAGTSRMNSVMVRRASWGLGRYLLDENLEVGRGVVIAFDGRRNSRRFAEDTAAVLASLGIPAHIFADPVPTPLCAFAVVELGAIAGVMVTASHNPPEDNGYKVYWSNGAQIVPPQDRGIAAAIARAPSLKTLPDAFSATRAGLRNNLSDALARRYLDAVREASWHPTSGRKDLSIVYTAMHGVGNHLVHRALYDAGFPQVISVPTQADPDGNFPTVRFPNPEEPGALDHALALAEETEPDLVLANDPDADRISATVRVDGAYRTLSGNDVGVLLGADAIIHAPDDKQALVITTIVSSTMLGRVARDLGAEYAETLTGFKWIANTALARTGLRFVCGYEEALGVSVGELVRDKDGVSAIVRLAELASVLKEAGKTLVDRLDELAIAHGLSSGSQWSMTLRGTEGAAKIVALMERFRANPPTALDGAKIVRRVDLLDGIEKTGLPQSDVLVFHTDDETRLTVRPSGTEPKIKFYLEALARPTDLASLASSRVSLGEKLARIRGELDRLTS